MDFQIRTADVRDYETVHRLMKDFSVFIKTPEKFTITLERMISEQEYIHCFVAETETDGIIGYATYFLTYYTWSGKSMYLEDLYVVDAFRGTGIGAALFDHVIGQARKEDCAKLKWQVSRWNDNAIAFYKKHGAIVDDTEINCDLKLRMNS